MFYMQCVSHKTHYSDHFSIFNRNHLYKMHCMRHMWEGPHLRAKSSHDANVSLGLQYALNMGTLLLKLFREANQRSQRPNMKSYKTSVVNWELCF